MAGLPQQESETLLKQCKRGEAAHLVANLEQAASAYALFALSRVARSQWRVRLTHPDGLARTWRLLKRLDEKEGIMPALQKRLGMSVSTFIQSSRVIFALAMTGKPQGHVDLRRDFSALETDWDVPKDVVQLAAKKLSIDSSTTARWHRNIVLAKSSAGFFQHCSSPLMSVPLIEVSTEEGRVDLYCPSPDKFISATEAVSSGSGNELPGSNYRRRQQRLRRHS